MTLEFQGLPSFSIKRFNLQNDLRFNDTRPQGRAEEGKRCDGLGHPKAGGIQKV